MSEQNSNPESMESPEKSADQIYGELNQTYDETMELMNQIHMLEMKAGEDGLSKEEFDSIVDERNKLSAQLDEKRKYENKLEEQWKKASDKELSKLEEEYKRLEK